MLVVALALALVASGVAAVVRLTRDGDGDASCYTTRSTTDPAYPGRSASRVYDWVDVAAQTAPRFSPGVAVPRGLLEGRYVPQGLAALPAAATPGAGPAEDLLLVSAYHDGDGDKEGDGPSAVFALVADGPRAGTSLGRMLIGPGHVGGLAVLGGWLYVGTEHEIRGYRWSSVQRALADPAAPGADAVQAPDQTTTSSHDVAFLGTGDGRLWAGRYTLEDTSTLTGYVQTSRRTGALTLQPDAGIPVPRKTQGVAVTADHVVFSTSYGRRARGNLRVVPRDAAAAAGATPYCFRVPSMNEGVTVLGDRVQLLFESGARTYDRGLLRPANPITAVHTAALADLTDLTAGGPTD